MFFEGNLLFLLRPEKKVFFWAEENKNKVFMHYMRRLFRWKDKIIYSFISSSYRVKNVFFLFKSQQKYSTGRIQIADIWIDNKCLLFRC